MGGIGTVEKPTHISGKHKRGVHIVDRVERGWNSPLLVNEGSHRIELRRVVQRATLNSSRRTSRSYDISEERNRDE
jgi:hypothetical protein